ncbi:hypothetical protein EJB05_36893, partial [Eragrostis curvula]
MFNEAAKKFYTIFEMGKVYYICKGPHRNVNKQFKTVQYDYELTLNKNAVVEEAEGEIFISQMLLKMRHDQEVAAFRTAARLFPGFGGSNGLSS